MKNDVIEFECISKSDVNIKIAGYVLADELDDESPLHFYDHQGLECGSYVPSNPFEEGTDDWEAYDELSSAFQSDDLFIQFLSDYSDENRTVDREDYFLKINDGAKIELSMIGSGKNESF